MPNNYGYGSANDPIPEEWTLIHNNTIIRVFDTSDEAYEYMYRNGLKNAHVMPPNKDRKISAHDAMKIQPNKGNMYLKQNLG